MREITPTANERAAISALKEVARKWPKTLWLFSASGTLCVMRADEDGGHHLLTNYGVDPAYILDTVNITTSEAA